MKKKSAPGVPKWQVWLSWTLEILILASGIYQTFFGETAIGILTLVALAFILFPKILTRGFVPRIPIEIEIILFVMVFVQFVLGEARDFYTTIPYYDKFVHYLLPMFLGLISFLLLYTLQETGNLRVSKLAMVILTVLIALAIGALWEICEYLSDRIFYMIFDTWHHFQGNAQQSAIDDTMTDLIIDTLGGVFGAVLGLWFTSKKAGTIRMKEITGDFAAIFSPKRK